MMRLRILALLLLFATGASAQEMHRLSGYVQIPGQEISKYFIQITITGTKISGYSITEEHGNRLRAMVSGVREPESEMTLEESKADNPGYCYFTAKLKLTIVSGRQRWAGPFESHESNGRLCGKGYMTLLDEAPASDAPPVKTEAPKPKPIVTPAPKPVVQALPKPKPIPVAAPAPVDTPKPKPKPKPVAIADSSKPPPKPKPVVIDTPKPKPVVVQAPQPKPKPVVMQAPEPKPQPRKSDSCTREYTWQSDSLILNVWDGWTLDGDVISIIIDGKRLMDHHKLGLEKDRIAVPISRGRHKLDLEFHEEGTEPPNTPNMILFDGSKRYDLNISGATGEKVRICVDR